MTNNIDDSLSPGEQKQAPFSGSSTSWLVINGGGGKDGDLDSCLSTLFEHLPAKQMPATYNQIKAHCLKTGYVSIDGWVVCYITGEGENTLHVKGVLADG